MANPIPGIDFPANVGTLPGVNVSALPNVAALPGNVHYVKQTTDSDYGAFFARHYQLYADGTTSIYNTVQAAVTAAAPYDTIYIVAGQIAAGGTDPVSYAEAVTIPATKAGLQLIGLANGTKQAAQPQIKKGSGSAAQLTVRAPGCLIQGITFNGGSATGGGILLDDDGSTKTTEGTIIRNCVLKNCVGSGATDGSTGGGVTVAATGGSWDTLIDSCLFYNNIGGVVFKGASNVAPQDITISNCIFTSSTAGGRDVDIWGNGSTVVALNIQYCNFGIFPAAGTKNTYMDLTGCTGLLARCNFASSGKTFGAAANVLVPTTVGIAGNYQDGALIART